MQFRIAQSLVAGVASSLAFVVAPPGRAEITKVTVTSAKDIGPFGGKAYREVAATMEGRAPGGPYSVPVTLAFPQRPADHSGVAVVDVVNTVTIGRTQWVIGGRPLPLARIHMGDAFLFGGGRSYVAPIWDKAAVEALTRILAEEMRGREITVNAVAPGPTETELFFEGKSEEVIERLKNLSPLGKLGQPDQIAAVVSFLAGPDGAWVNGQTIRANGGTV